MKKSTLRGLSACVAASLNVVSGAAWAQNLTPIPLGAAANRALVDETSDGDGQGGWSDQGPKNSLNGFPTGRTIFRGVPFQIAQSGNAALIFGGSALGERGLHLPAEATLPVSNGRGGVLYLLSTAIFGGNEDLKAADLVVQFADGTSQTTELRYGRDTGSLWSPKGSNKTVVVWEGKNGLNHLIGVYLTPITLDNIASPVTSITVRANTTAKPSLAVLGLTVGDIAPKEILPKPPAWQPWSENDQAGWWEIPKPYDTVSQAAPWEAAMKTFQPAGSLGWTKTAGENLVFERQPGVPIRVRGICGGGTAFYPQKSEAERYAKVLRKYGYNQLRVHSLFDSFLEDVDGGYKIPKWNTRRLDRFDYLVAELKKQGIYINPSGLYTIRWAPETGVKAPDKVEGLNNTQYNYDERHQELYIQVLREFLNHKNPYTGLTYAQEPALQMWKVQNENSLFFYTSDAVAPAYRIQLQDKWNAWLKRKYRDQNGLIAAWRIEGQPSPVASNENLADDLVALMGIATLSTPPESQKQRASDQARFYQELETTWFQKVQATFRELGSQTLIQGSSWYGPRWLQEMQTAANAPLDFTGKHTYWDHPSGGWRLEDALFHNRPIVESPADNIINPAFQHVAGKPFAITEWQLCVPNDFSQIGPAFFAAYAGMQNININHHFTFDNPEVKGTMTGFFDVFAMPGQLALSPFSYFLYSRGDIQTAPVIYQNALDDNALHDPNRGKNAQVRESDNRFFVKYDAQAVPDQAMLVGGVRLSLDPQKHPAKWDEATYNRLAKDGVYTSNTGELVWDSKGGQIHVKTPRSRGLLGFFRGSSLQNGPLSMKLNSAYGAATFSSLETAPLEQSSKILMTLVGRVRHTDQTWDILTQDGKPVTTQLPVRLGNKGLGPMRMEPATIEFTLQTNKNGAWTMQPLDINGNPTGDPTKLIASGGKLVGKADGATNKAFHFLLTLE